MVFWLFRVYRRIRSRKSLGIVAVLILLLVSIFGNALAFCIFDDKPFGDAVWYSVISITTIGYGDFSSVSVGARIGTFIFIVCLGLSTFTAFVAMMIDWITDYSMRGQRGMAQIDSKDHILLVNFPSVNRVRQLIDELKSDAGHAAREIVVVTDQLDSLPFQIPNVLFVNGSPLLNETYERANIGKARMALVLCTSYSDPNSDAVVASAVSVIDRLHSDIYIVAECADESHRMLFESVRCDAIVPGMRIAGNLLVQEVHDPGISQMVDVITSNLKGSTLFSTQVPDAGGQGEHYNEIAKQALDRDINILCVNRGANTHTKFTNLQPAPGDVIVYVASRRLTWPEVVGRA